MAELIAKNRAQYFVCDFCIEHYKDEPCEPNECAWMAAIDAEPAVDAVEVVRCKDSKHYQYGVIFTDIKFCCRLKDKNGKPRRYSYCDNDFCSYGERREDDEKP